MSKQSNVVEFPSNWPSVAGNDTSTPKQKRSRGLNWAKFMVEGMEAQLKYLLSQDAIDPAAFRMAIDTMDDLKHSIAFKEKLAQIESEYRQRYGVL